MTDGQLNILKGVGAWMDINSDSIYATEGNPFGKDPSWGTYTLKDKKLYAHVFEWPKNGKLEASVLKGKVKKVYLLSNPKTVLKYKVKSGTISITLPKSAPSSYDSVIVIEYSALN